MDLIMPRSIKNRFLDKKLLNAKTVEETKETLAAGANVYAKNKWGKTYLDYADIKQTELIKQVMKQHEKNLETKNRIKSTPRLKSISGVVVADKIAEMKRSGIIKGDITPEMGKMLRGKIMRDYFMNTKR